MCVSDRDSVSVCMHVSKSVHTSECLPTCLPVCVYRRDGMPVHTIVMSVGVIVHPTLHLYKLSIAAENEPSVPCIIVFLFICSELIHKKRSMIHNINLSTLLLLFTCHVRINTTAIEMNDKRGHSLLSVIKANNVAHK